MKRFDLLVIGAGSGGLAVAIRAAAHGAKVAVINSGAIGGTCVNVGCVPKKITWYASQLSEDFNTALSYGYQSDPAFDFKKFAAARKKFIKKLNGIYAERLKQHKISVIKGSAHFLDAKTISVNNKSYTAKYIIIATGCTPKRPLIPGAEFGIDSDDFFHLTALPKKIAIVGSGYIAAELASLLAQLGSKVQLLMRKGGLLDQFDSMLSGTLETNLQNQGIEILKHHETTEIKRQSNKKLTVHLKSKKSLTNFDAVLFAIGRSPQLQSLNLKAAGVKINDQGSIVTDKWQTTNIPNIYAIGDVTGKKMLTPVAVAAGRCLADRLFGGKKGAHLDYNNIPTVVFAHPPLASVGLSEDEAVEKYGRNQIAIYQHEFQSLFYALEKNKHVTKIKLITLKKSEKVIGLHMIGMNADEILQGFAVAIKMGATKKDFDTTVALHPTSAEEFVALKPKVK